MIEAQDQSRKVPAEKAGQGFGLQAIPRPEKDEVLELARL